MTKGGEDFRLILAAYLSEQMSERQWQNHLTDPLFANWVRFHMMRCITPPGSKMEN